MELTVFIKRSNHPMADKDKTKKSLKHTGFFVKQFVFIDKFENIDYEGIQTDWYLILYDNEALDKELLEAMPALLNETRIKAFSFYKSYEHDKYSICPRLFRKEIRISPNCLYPVNEREPIMNVLNGFVVEHD